MKKWWPALAAVVLLASLAGCVSFSAKTTGAASVEDLKAENDYIALYMDHMTKYGQDLKVYAPSGSNPGPCNKGGSAPDCVAADQQALATLSGMQKALQSVTVPPRFTEADRLLRDALANNITGLQLRVEALTNQDDAKWTQSKDAIAAAQKAWTAAYAAFPSDNKPPLAP